MIKNLTIEPLNDTVNYALAGIRVYLSITHVLIVDLIEEKGLSIVGHLSLPALQQLFGSSITTIVVLLLLNSRGNRVTGLLINRSSTRLSKLSANHFT